MAPVIMVPLHTHPSAEMIYVLEGEASFQRLLADGSEEWLTCSPGESVLAPANVPHGEGNRSEKPATALSISTYYHQEIFDEVGVQVQPNDPVPSFDPAVFEHFAQMAEKHQCYLVSR